MLEGLGRWSAPDDRDYPLRAALGSEALPRYMYWYSPRVLDQGTTSSCVGHAWRSFISASPYPYDTGPPAIQIYREAQKRDPWPGEEPSYYGTSVRAGIKYLQELGMIAEYRFTFSAEEAMRYVLTRGPLVAGTDWLESMFHPNSRGFIKVGGSFAGGHAYMLVGANRERGVFRIQNSWGPNWGQRGRAWISGENLQHLLEAQGECCSALERGIA